MKIDGNMNNVKETPMLPPGVYSAMILKEPTAVISSQKKTPGIEFEFTLMDAGTEIAPGVPRTIKDTIYKSEKFGWEHFRMKEIIEACGANLESPDTTEFVNVPLKLAIGQEPYTDKHGAPKVKMNIDNFLKA